MEVKYIKNPTESAGDSEHIEAELAHLQALKEGKSVREFLQKKEMVKSGNGSEHGEKRVSNYVEVHAESMTPDKPYGFKTRTRS